MLRYRFPRRRSSRSYPDAYEKSLPWILVGLSVFVLLLIAAVVLVLTGKLPVLR